MARMRSWSWAGWVAGAAIALGAGWACGGADEEAGNDAENCPTCGGANKGGGAGSGGGSGGGTGGTLDSDASGAGEKTSGVGKGSSTPFDPKGNGSSGVKTNPDGDIVIDPTNFGGGDDSIIWIANSPDGTVSKVDTRTMKELARYRTGPGSADPSRTTVGLNGDVVVANRGGASATKIAANPIDCVGPGGGTSSGPADVRAWGDDKCVLWNTPFPGGSLARAAAFDAEKGVDGELSTSVWIGLFNLHKMVQLNSKDGKVLDEVDVSPIQPYGAAIDKLHQVWFRGPGGVGVISGKAPAHVFKQVKASPCPYGIAVDQKGRVWTSGGGCVSRYTPSLDQWDQVSVGSSNRGLAVDAKGTVWVADTSFGMHRIDLETLAVVKSLNLSPAGVVGAAIDFDGKGWIISQGGSMGEKIDPGTYAVSQVKVGSNPYTYSDMTGFQLRNAVPPFGKYRQPFSGCGEKTQWKSLDWTAKTDVGTTVTIRVRTAKTKEGLGTAAWKLVAKQPPDQPPIDLAAKLGAEAFAAWIEVEFLLETTKDQASPVLSAIAVKYGCPPNIQ